MEKEKKLILKNLAFKLKQQKILIIIFFNFIKINNLFYFTGQYQYNYFYFLKLLKNHYI